MLQANLSVHVIRPFMQVENANGRNWDILIVGPLKEPDDTSLYLIRIQCLPFKCAFNNGA